MIKIYLPINMSVNSIYITIFLVLCVFATEIQAKTLSYKTKNFPSCNTLWNKEFLSFSHYNDWKVEYSGGVNGSLVNNSSLNIESNVLSLIFKTDKNYPKSPQIVISSETISKIKYYNLKATSLIYESQENGKIRIILKDKNGRAFYNRSPLSLTNTLATETKSTYHLDNIIYHGNADDLKQPFVPLPPFTVDHIRVALPQGRISQGIVKLSQLRLFLQDESSLTKKVQSTYTDWFLKNCNVSNHGELLVDLETPDQFMPIKLGNVVPLKVSTNNSNIITKLTLSVNRYSSTDGLSKDITQIQSSAHNSIRTYKHKFDIPGLYSVVVSAFGADQQLLARSAQEVLVWEPVGNLHIDHKPNFFGMMYLDRFSKTRNQDLQVMASAGVKVIRFPFRWSEIETKRGSVNWTNYDTLMKDLKTNNFIAQPMFFYTPSWASKKLYSVQKIELAKDREQWIAPKNNEVVSSFIGKAARRYSEQNVVWEFYNEPTERKNWIGGNAQDYVNHLKAINPSIKSNAPSSSIITAGIGVEQAEDQSFAPFLAQKIEGIVDGFSVHSYGGYLSAASSIVSTKALFPQKSSLKVWLNETGYLVDPKDPLGEMKRSSELVKTAVISRYMDIENFSWFIFRNYSSAANSSYDNYSLVGSDGLLRSPILAYANTVKWLSGTKPVRKVKLYNNIIVHEFINNKSQSVLVSWLDDEYTTAKFNIHDVVSKVGSVKAYDVYGGEVSLSREGEVLTQKHSPIFIIYR